MFTEKTQALKERDTIQEKSSKLMAIVVEACIIVPELHIPKDAQLEAMIQKLVAGVYEAKVKVARVQFEINMKIT